MQEVVHASSQSVQNSIDWYKSLGGITVMV